MKYLQNYTEQAQTALFEELGVFFAFSNSQFDEGVAKYGHLKPEGTKWASMGMGMYLPKINAEEFMERHSTIVKDAMLLDVKENGKDGVINRELNNYECYYTGDPTEAINILKDYGFTRQEVMEQFKAGMELQYA